MSELLQQIKFEIKDGKVHFDAEGFNGVGCDAATKFLQELGDTEKHHKPEYGGQRQRLLQR